MPPNSHSVTVLARVRGLAGAAVLLLCQVAFGQDAVWVEKSERAKRAMQERRYGEAVSLYRELTKGFPNNPGLAMNLGLALHSAGDYSQAVRQFQLVVKIQPQLAPAWFMLGLGLQKLERSKEAIEPLERCLQLDPRNDAARLELADALFQSGRFEEAIPNFRSLADADPRNTKAWLGLGLSYASLAGAAVDRLEKQSPDSGYFHMLVGKSLADQNQHRSAFHHYREALERNPELTDGHREIASIYRAIGNASWAEIEERKASAAPNGCREPSYSCLFAEKRYDELLRLAERREDLESDYWLARTYNELALAAHVRLQEAPPSAELHQLLAVLYDMRELYPDAAREWRDAISFQPNNRNFQSKLAHSLWSAGEWRAAAETARALLDGRSESPELRFLLGDSLLKMQLPAEAAPHLTSAIAQRPNHLQARASLATAYIRLAEPSRAIPHLEAALPTDRDGSLRYQLAQAYRSVGQAERAARLLTEYRQIREAFDRKNAQSKAESEITPPAEMK